MSDILIVDDAPEVAATLRELLAQHGFKSVVAGSGEDAIELLAASPKDLVLLDARLPGLSGFETCARIRAAHGASLPVLMITAFGDREAVRRAMEAGADDLLHKPIDTPALMLKLRSHLRLKSLNDELLASREQARARVRDLAVLHEIGRDWSLLAEPAEFHRTVTQRLAGLIGAPICALGLYDPSTRTLAAALPAHGLPDEVALALRYDVRPEYRSMWSFKTGRPYVSNKARTDPRLIQDMVQLAGAENLVLVPMISEGRVLGLIVAANKPGGFTEADAQLLSIFAGPAATFLRSRQIFERQRRHAERLERLADSMGAMASTASRAALVELAVSRIRQELGYERVAFWSPDQFGHLRLEMASGVERPAEFPVDAGRLKWSQRGGSALQAAQPGVGVELTVPVLAGQASLGVLDVLRLADQAFEEEEVNLLTALAGHFALALQKAAGAAETERLARQMATLYDVGLETSALRDLRQLFAKAAEESGRLIRADHTSVLRLHDPTQELRLFAAWGREPEVELFAQPTFRIGHGIAGRVARDWVPAMVNEVGQHPDFVERDQPVARILCVPLSYYDREREAPALFGVLNATRRPGEPPFSRDDLEYLTRFAGQLSIAVANSMAFDAERERSEQLALVNTLVREIAGNLSRDRIFTTAVRRIHEAFAYPAVLIGVPDRNAGVLRIAASAGRPPGAEGWGSLPLGAGAAGRALRERRTVVVSDVALDPNSPRIAAWAASEAAVPVLSGGDLVALLAVESDQPGAFRRGDVMTLETLADSIGIILRNAELYQAVERTNTRLVELDRLKTELVNIVAHDFRAPLAGVLGYAELLEWRADAPVEERVENARAIVNAATHMSQLVEKTLKTSRLESGQFPFDFGLIDLAATVHSVLERLPPSATHSLALEISEDPLPCWADRARLAEVIENLLSNAVKYSPAGGEVRLEVRREKDVALLRVSDKGIGFAAEDADKLFRPFSRVRNETTAAIDGSGLGLYICDRIVKAHGGQLTAESRRGEGSCFSVTLPLFGAAAQTHMPLVLVAAVDEATRREVRRAAAELGFATQEAADGVEAVEAALRLRPTAVVLDRVLPRLGAEQVAERLRSQEALPAVRLVVLASDLDLGASGELFDACVPKPLERNVLIEALAPSARGLALDASRMVAAAGVTAKDAS